jgi:hypothetical protein
MLRILIIATIVCGAGGAEAGETNEARSARAGDEPRMNADERESSYET